MVKRAYSLLGITVFILSSIYILLLSESGLLERLRLKSRISIIEKKVQDLKRENESLHLLLEKQGKGYLSKDDFLNSGLISDEEKFLFIRHRNDETGIESIAENSQTKIMNITVFRVAWILFSIIVITIVYRKSKDMNP